MWARQGLRHFAEAESSGPPAQKNLLSADAAPFVPSAQPGPEPVGAPPAASAAHAAAAPPA
eukprot:6314988-Alexandrium_andersonii.AAC.1